MLYDDFIIFFSNVFIEIIEQNYFQKIVRLCVNEVFNMNINNTPVVQNVLLGSADLSSFTVPL